MNLKLTFIALILRIKYTLQIQYQLYLSSLMKLLINFLALSSVCLDRACTAKCANFCLTLRRRLPRLDMEVDVKGTVHCIKVDRERK